MTQIIKRSLLLTLCIFTISGMVLAQGGNGNRPGGDARPTRTVPQITPPAVPTISAPQITPPAVPTISVPDVNPPDIDVDDITAEIQAVWESYQIPENIPTSTDDLQAMINGIEIPYDLDLDDINITAQTDEVAYAAITNFALQFLGVGINPLFAAEISGEQLANLPRLASSQSSMEISTISEMFPEEIQALLTNIPGTTYGAIMNDGGALLTVDVDCATLDRDCGLTTENMYVEISEASFGGLALYRTGTLTNATEAEAFIKATYPALNNLAFIPIDVAEGFAFSAVNIDVMGFVSTVYYTGTYSIDNHTVFYALVASGRNDGSDAQTYIDILLPEGF